MAGKLSGKVALVTGGSAGIGLGIAKRFAEEGARVFATGRRRSELDKAVASIGGNAAGLRGDVSDLADLDRIFAQIRAEADTSMCWRQMPVFTNSARSGRSPRNSSTRRST